MTRAELEAALEQQRTENATLQAALAEQRRFDGVLRTHVPSSLQTYLLGQTHAAVVVCDIDGFVQWVNKGFAAPLEGGLAEVYSVIQDTGIGHEAGFLAQVFDDFSQEDSSITRQFGGTGLGLGISKKLVELMGGQLRIESQKNQGTTSRFTLRVPIGTGQDVPHKEVSGLSGLEYSLRGKRILLVEDNTFNRMLATNSELVVTEALNGQVAVELAQVQKFDLVLMDVQMPVMNGYQATACSASSWSWPCPSSPLRPTPSPASAKSAWPPA